MAKIYKYPVRIADQFTIEMPAQAQILSVHMQGESPQLWALVRPTAPCVRRAFAIRGTGHDATFMGEAPFVGTFQLHGGALVFHLFDLGEQP